tara:strand:+ start:1388 stop:2215 length:828 start_codon:yes stop_codon:yes gene_type:complete
MLFGAVSCTTKMAYNNLDWIASWYIDDYVTLTNDQENDLETRIESFLLWHRNTELQNYLVQIKYIQIDFNNGITQSNIENYIESLKGFLEVVLVKAEPDIVNLAYSLTDKQVTEFLAEFEQQSRDKIDKQQSLSKGQRLEDRLEKIEHRVTSFTGKLSKSQKQLLDNTNKKLLPAFEQRMQFRRDWANAISAAYVIRSGTVLESEDKKQAFRLALRDPILQSKTFCSEAYLAILEHNQKIWVNMLEKLIVSLDEKQQDHLNTKLDNTIKDLQKLF